MSTARPGRPGDARGVTLIEILLALSIMGVIVVVLVGSARVAIRAWEAGERQAAAQQEIRALVELLTDTLSAAFPYKGRLGAGVQRVVLFQGEEDEVRFVTTAPPLTLDAAAAPYHAVTLRRSGEDELQLVERLVPAEEPFGDDPVAVISRTVTGFRLQYLDDKGAWQDTWDGPQAGALPAAVRVELSIRGRLRPETVPIFVVPIPLGKAAA